MLDMLDTNTVKLLALRIVSNETDSMRKNLKADASYCFFQNIWLDGDRTFISPDPAAGLFDTVCNSRKISVSISAIVGENGAGKSTIVDYIVRILNNLSAYIQGEFYKYPSAEHLHYIYGVYAELYLQCEEGLISIYCEDEKLIVYKHNLVGSKEGIDVYEKDIQHLIIKDRQDKNSVYYEKPHYQELLRKICYTIVTNYSLYSFCAVNYKNEQTDYKKENRIRQQGIADGYDVATLDTIRRKVKERECSSTDYYDARNWLLGLFHKNDGYQTPIVIAPMRTYGRIDLLKEHKLAKERLVSLVFLRNEQGKFYFNRINGKLIIDAVEISKDFNEEQKYKNAEQRSRYLSQISEPSFRDIYGIIRSTICNICQITGVRRDHEQLVWGYIVQKILKIIFTYPRYRDIREHLTSFKSEFDREGAQFIEGAVKEILKDHSHVTRKLYRCINYLRFDHIDRHKRLTFETFGEDIYRLRDAVREQSIYNPQYTDELLPPPVFHVNFQLYDIHDTNKTQKIDFSTLSSGEKQITYALSSFFYQIINIDSSGHVLEEMKIKEEHEGPFVKIHKEADKKQLEPDFLTYRHVTAIFDEIELYFHPEMQRLFVSNLIDGLTQLELNRLESIHIMLATHSPFILSDIPSNNVLFLGKDGYPKPESMYTFGANIHTMLKNSFFLEKGSMGEYVQKKIHECQKVMNKYIIQNEINQIIKTGPLGAIEENLKDLEGCNYRKLKDFDEGSFFEWQNLNFDDEAYILEEKDVKEQVNSFVNLIQEPLVKMVMQEQFSKWTELCGF